MLSLEVGKKYTFKDPTHTGYVIITCWNAGNNTYSGNWHYNSTQNLFLSLTDYWGYDGSSTGPIGFDLDKEFQEFILQDNYEFFSEDDPLSEEEPKCYCPMEQITNEWNPHHNESCAYIAWKKKRKTKEPLC